MSLDTLRVSANANATMPITTQDETLGQRIARFRKSRGWSQARLGVEVSRALKSDSVMSATTVSNWETGRFEAARENVEALCQVFGVSYDEMVPKSAPSTEEAADTVALTRELARRAGVSEKALREAMQRLTGGQPGQEPGPASLPPEAQGDSGIRASRQTPGASAVKRRRHR